jgi:hypothetical protein
MDTPTLKQILHEEMQAYAGDGLNVRAHLTVNEAENLYAIIDFADVRGKRFVGTPLVARLIANKVVIDLDQNDKLLVDALKARGVPGAQIILAYRGEIVPA